MLEMTHARHYERHLPLFGCIDHFVIAYRAAWFDRCNSTSIGGFKQSISEREKGIACN
jgi:hypothetical protein